MSIHLTADHGGVDHGSVDGAERHPRPTAARRRPVAPTPLVLIRHSWVTVTDDSTELTGRRAA